VSHFAEPCLETASTRVPIDVVEFAKSEALAIIVIPLATPFIGITYHGLVTIDLFNIKLGELCILEGASGSGLPQ